MVKLESFLVEVSTVEGVLSFVLLVSQTDGLLVAQLIELTLLQQVVPLGLVHWVVYRFDEPVHLEFMIEV